MTKKVLFVATVVKKHINVFHIPYLKMLKEMGFETHVAARNDYEDPSDCVIPYCDFYHDIPFERNPLKLNNIRAYKQLEKLMIEENFDIIHCHTPVGGAMPRLVIKNHNNLIKSKIIYTAHGFHFFDGAPLKNWIIFYPIEKWLSKYTDALIVINKQDYDRANKHFHMKKLVYVPGVGIDLNKYNLKDFHREDYRADLGFNDHDFIIMSVGEISKRKNHQEVIRALSIIDNSRIHYVIVGEGPEKENLQRLAEELNVKNVDFLGFRKDIPYLLHCADLFVFPSTQEGLPVALMEALACGVPSIASKVRGSEDLVVNNMNGFLYTLHDVNELAARIKQVISENLDFQKTDMSKYSLDECLSDVRKVYMDETNF